MRIFFGFVLLFMFGLLVLALAPDTEKPLTINNEVTYPVETVKDNVRDVTPGDTLPGPVITENTITRLPGVVVEAVVEKKALPRTIHNNVLITAAGVFKSGEQVVHLSGITPLNLTASCKAENGENWPCGRFARTAMRGFVRGRALNCDAVDLVSGPIKTQCRIGDSDIGEWLVKQGWARGAKGSVYENLVPVAKSSKTGMWRLTPP